MDDLISRVSLASKVATCDPRMALRLINTKPAVWTVRHARWIVTKNACGKEYTYCSHCDSTLAVRRGLSLENLDLRGTKYCPVCGSRMDL